MNHNASTLPIIIPESLRIATLLPLVAIRPNLPAEPLRLVLMEEKVFDCNITLSLQTHQVQSMMGQ